MNKKEKTASIVALVYIGLLLISLILLFTDILVKFMTPVILVIIFFVILILGYVVVAILRINAYRYICPECKLEHKLDFFEYMFAHRNLNQRKIICPNCKKSSYMDRISK